MGPESPLAHRVHLSCVSQVSTSPLNDKANPNPLPPVSWEGSTGPTGQKVASSRTRGTMTSGSPSTCALNLMPLCLLGDLVLLKITSHPIAPNSPTAISDGHNFGHSGGKNRLFRGRHIQKGKHCFPGEGWAWGLQLTQAPGMLRRRKTKAAQPTCREKAAADGGFRKQASVL